VRAAALATVKEVRDKVDVEALELTDRLFAQHRVAIKELPDIRQQEYEDIRAMATDRQKSALRPPRTRIEGFSVEENGQVASALLAPLHLMSNVDGQFPLTSLNNWEREVVLAELARPNVRGWYRNPTAGRSRLTQHCLPRRRHWQLAIHAPPVPRAGPRAAGAARARNQLVARAPPA
jgi:type III restriction enzyme